MPVTERVHEVSRPVCLLLVSLRLSLSPICHLFALRLVVFVYFACLCLISHRHADLLAHSLCDTPSSISDSYRQKKSTTPHICKQSVGGVFFAGQQLFGLLGQLKGRVGLGDGTIAALPTAAPASTSTTQCITGVARGTTHLPSQTYLKKNELKKQKKNTKRKKEKKETGQGVRYCPERVNSSRDKRDLAANGVSSKLHFVVPSTTQRDLLLLHPAPKKDWLRLNKGFFLSAALSTLSI